MFNGAAIL